MKHVCICALLVLVLSGCGAQVRACGDDCPPLPTPAPTGTPWCGMKFRPGWDYYPKTEYTYKFRVVCDSGS